MASTLGRSETLQVTGSLFAIGYAYIFVEYMFIYTQVIVIVYRVPLSPELREMLEVAYVSKIMSKNFRKEGQPEKERIAKITGMDIDKVNTSENCV